MAELIAKVEIEFYRNGQMRIIRSGDRFIDAPPITLTDSGAAIGDAHSTPDNYVNLWWEVSPSPGYARRDPAPIGFFVGFGAEMHKVFNLAAEELRKSRRRSLTEGSQL